MDTSLLIVNRAIPIICSTLLITVLMGKRVCTKNFILAALLHCWAIREILLIWADWGSAVYTPSRQSLGARVLELIILMLFIALIKLVTKRGYAIK